MKILIIIGIFLMVATSFGENLPKVHIVKVKKSLSGKSESSVMRKVGSDKEYNYYEVSEDELKIIEQARIIFQKARKLPPPSKHMQDKMQDQVGYEESK